MAHGDVLHSAHRSHSPDRHRGLGARSVRRTRSEGGPRDIRGGGDCGLTTFGWRLVANVDALNADGINWVSANDVLAGFLTYLTLGMFAALVPPTDLPRYDRLRVAVAAAAIAVNIIVI